MNISIARRFVKCATTLLCAIVAEFQSHGGEALPAIDLKPAFPNLSFNRPLWMEEIPDGSKRMVVVEQDGRVHVFPKDAAVKQTKMFVDITSRKPHVQNEEGLLAFAFHPQYKSNGRFYLYYTQQSPKREVLSEMQVSKADPDKADPATERVLLEIPHPYWNHNGSTAAFGPDGYLYLSQGDGGAGGDPHNVGQSGHHLLAKILRLDVNSKTGSLQYGIPKDNPFVAKDKQGNPKADPFDTNPEGLRPEIWAYGLRNVWRMSFDRETGELWAGDVGQDKWEEVDLIVKGGNYGWSPREGFHEFKNARAYGEKPRDPVIEYPHNAGLSSECKFPDHSPGVSITGGYVYRGKRIPALRGVYVYGDFQMGTIWGLKYENGQVTAHGTLSKENLTRQIPSFAEDADGEIYVLSFDGKIYEIAARQ
jgi:quinoprotein glucose dehydrogenase